MKLLMSRNKREGKFQGFICGKVAVRGQWPIEGYAPAYINRKQFKQGKLAYKRMEESLI